MSNKIAVLATISVGDSVTVWWIEAPHDIEIQHVFPSDATNQRAFTSHSRLINSTNIKRDTGNLNLRDHMYVSCISSTSVDRPPVENSNSCFLTMRNMGA